MEEVKHTHLVLHASPPALYVVFVVKLRYWLTLIADLVLTDPPLSLLSVSEEREDSIILEPSGLVLPSYPHESPKLPNGKIFDPGNALRRAFGNFITLVVVKLMTQYHGLSIVDPTFLGLLVVSEAQSIVLQLERDMRRLQSRATKVLERPALEAMGAFRRTLAGLRELISDTKMHMMRWEVDMLAANRAGTVPNSPDQKSSVKRGLAKKDATHIDLAILLDKVAKLEEILETMTKTVNEEIQLFIASISIRDSEVMMADSRIMREDSQVMKQQAARTTLLTTLAVVYLPLQLITGIFGMNIKEITRDGGPRWWACLIALGVGGVLTFLVYLGVKWWQWRDSLRKERDGEKEKEE
jgi:hypothetical protein